MTKNDKIIKIVQGSSNGIRRLAYSQTKKKIWRQRSFLTVPLKSHNKTSRTDSKYLLWIGYCYFLFSKHFLSKINYFTWYLPVHSNISQFLFFHFFQCVSYYIVACHLWVYFLYVPYMHSDQRRWSIYRMVMLCLASGKGGKCEYIMEDSHFEHDKYCDCWQLRVGSSEALFLEVWMESHDPQTGV